jgi:hypothetical protein
MERVNERMNESWTGQEEWEREREMKKEEICVSPDKRR